MGMAYGCGRSVEIVAGSTGSGVGVGVTKSWAVELSASADAGGKVVRVVSDNGVVPGGCDVIPQAVGNSKNKIEKYWSLDIILLSILLNQERFHWMVCSIWKMCQPKAGVREAWRWGVSVDFA